jgi:hypothetical protein
MKKLSTLLILSLIVAVLPLAASAEVPVDLTLTTPPAGGTVQGGTVPAGGTQALLDDFNRADGPIGAGWTVHSGYCNVVSNAATCGGPGEASFNGAPGDGNFAEIDLAVFSSSLDYQGVVLNRGASNYYPFIKVQNQSGGMQFCNAACYLGNNGSGGSFGLGFFALTQCFGSAHMAVTRVGNDVTIEFTNIDGGAQPPQTYVCTGAPAPDGTGIGINGYSALDRVDNFGGPGGGMQEPDIEVTPASLYAEQCPDTTTTQTLQICNVGDAELTWSLSEVPAPKAPAGPAVESAAGQKLLLQLDGAGGPGVETNPPIVNAPVSLVLDDGSRENDIGIGGTLEMIWVNRFTPDPGLFPFSLTEVQVYFSSVGLVNVGDDMKLVIYENTTGNNDPAVGSNLLASFDVTVQALNVWNVYTLPVPVTFAGPGDAVVGLIGMEVPGTSYWPASIDQTATQARSWAGWWNSSPPPVPPLLPPPNWTLIDAYFPGNWMVRGYGETGGAPDIPWLSEDPTGGAVPAGDCVDVDVTFDSTGLAVGAYYGDLLIDSNDPDEPAVDVPVDLAVQDCSAIPDIEVTPLSLLAEQCPDAVTQQMLSVCNVGTADLTWTLAEAEPPKGTQAVLWDNGPLVTHPGGGYNGEDASVLQTNLGLNTYGFGNQFLNGYRMADDFTITDPAGWDIQQITFFAYQTGTYGYPPVSTITGLYFQIWNGLPDDPGSTVVFGDLATNRLAGTSWPNMYRVLDTAMTNTQRPPMANVGTAGVVLPPGTYWLDWMTDGSGASGPWAPPISIVGQTTTGNALQYTGAWAAAVDTGLGTPQGMPFIVEGAVAGPGFDAPWLSEDPVSGTILPGECQDVTVTFDSTGLAAGDYFANLVIDSNDPDEPQVIVPVQLTVLECGNTLTCGLITHALTLDPYGRELIKWWVEAVDQGGAIVPLVTVAADLTWPTGGPVSRTRLTHFDGYARFHWGSVVPGTWTIDVTNMTLAPYTFIDGPQCTASVVGK